MRYAISFVSTAVNDLTQSEVVEILQNTESRNDHLGINGLLVYSEGNFFEVIEGEKNKILELYETILEDPRHKNLIKIFEKEVHKKLFKDEEAHFIAENTLYRKMEVENFLDCIKDLDQSSQNMVKNMLTLIGINSKFQDREILDS